MPIERLDRLLANTGVGTRSQARERIRRGAVRIGDRVARDPAEKAEARLVSIEGVPLAFPDGLFVAFHKPVGLVCSHDAGDGPRIYDVLPDVWTRRNPIVTSIGRLDRDSSGLLLLTDRGDLVHHYASPRRHVVKRYVVTLDRAVTTEMIDVLAAGTLVLDGSACRPARVVAAPSDAPSDAPARNSAEVFLDEGRHRQIRRMFDALGAEVVVLHRTRVGEHELGDLALGEWRVLDLP